MPQDIELVETILALLPPEWRVTVITWLAFVGALSAALSLLTPLTVWLIKDERKRWWADAIFTVLEWFALNFRSIRDRPLSRPKPKAKS